MNIEKKGILNKREYLGPVWLADVWPADDIPFCSIFTYFQYSLIHDLALCVEYLQYIRIKKDRSDLIQHQDESFGIKYDPKYFFW